MQGTFTDEVINLGYEQVSDWEGCVIVEGTEAQRIKEFVGRPIFGIGLLDTPTIPIFNKVAYEASILQDDGKVVVFVKAAGFDEIARMLARPDMPRKHKRELSSFTEKYSSHRIFIATSYMKASSGHLFIPTIAVASYCIAYTPDGDFDDFLCFKDDVDEKYWLMGLQIPVLCNYYLHQKADIELIDYPRNYRRRIKRQTGKEPSPYFLLKVGNETRKQSASVEYTNIGSKSKAPLHIVRGHFRHVENHPIEHFNGTFWIPAHTRGDKANGEIKKGYTIRLPEAS